MYLSVAAVTPDHRLARLLVAATLTLAGCGTATPTPRTTTPEPGTSAGPGTSAAPTPPASSRAVIIDTDLGADDLTALAVLLRDPSVDVRAITVPRTGLGRCGPGLRNLRNLIADLGRREIPIGCGHAGAGPEAYPFPEDWRALTDQAYGLTFVPAPATSPGGDAAAVIADAVAASPTPPLIVALGPWTNLAEAFAADTTLPRRLAGIHAMGGTLDARGNVWADGKDSPSRSSSTSGRIPRRWQRSWQPTSRSRSSRSTRPTTSPSARPSSPPSRPTTAPPAPTSSTRCTPGRRSSRATASSSGIRPPRSPCWIRRSPAGRTRR